LLIIPKSWMGIKMNNAVRIGRIKTSQVEIRDITKAWLAISFAFAFIYSGSSVLNGSISNIFSGMFLYFVVVSLFTAGLGFLLHEMAHKFVAQRYGCVAEFRAWDQFLYLAVGLAVFIGFIFAAPGAVMISGQITRRENGIISVAGPLTNYVLAGIFFVLSLAFAGGPLTQAFSIGFGINMWLGLFNLIPFGNLDGYKVFQWNKLVWGVMVAIGVLFIFIL
jgi:Zn-dependent protease